MKEPSKTLQALGRIGSIHSISVKYAQTGTDSAEDRVTLVGSHGQLSGKWDTYAKYLRLRVWCGRVAKLHDNYLNELTAWAKFQKDNAEEYQEYLRLKEKFG